MNQAEVHPAVEAGRLRLARDKMTRVEAAGFAVFRLSCGDSLSAGWLATLTGRTAKDCRLLLEELSRTAPIYGDEGFWRMVLDPR